MSGPSAPQRDELVSVIIPVYNASRFVGATLESVLDQTHTALEILVVDDGSTDDSAAIVEQMAGRDSRIRLIRQANAGVAAARNRAIAEASGSFLAPVDADDVWRPDKLEVQLTALRSDPGAGLAYAWHTRIDTSGNIAGPFDFRPTFSGRILPIMALQNIVGASVPLMRTELVRSVGGYDTSLRLRGGQGSEDWLLQCRLAAAAEVVAVPRFLVGYRQVPASMSRHAERALASHLVATADLERAHPGLDRDVLRWSETIHAFWIAANHARESQYMSARKMLMWGIRRQYAVDRRFMFKSGFLRYGEFRLRRVGRRLTPLPSWLPRGRPFIGTDLAAAEKAPPFPGEQARYRFMEAVAPVWSPGPRD